MKHCCLLILLLFVLTAYGCAPSERYKQKLCGAEALSLKRSIAL
jgi:hypothetical protein